MSTMSTMTNPSTSSTFSVRRYSTIRPDVPPKPSHLHSISVRASAIAPHPPIPTTLFRGVPVNIVRTGLVKARLGQLGGAGGGGGDSGTTVEDTFEAERKALRLERERRRAAIEAEAAAAAAARAAAITAAAEAAADGGNRPTVLCHIPKVPSENGGSTLKVSKPRHRKTSARAMDAFLRQHAGPSPVKDNTRLEELGDGTGTVRRKGKKAEEEEPKELERQGTVRKIMIQLAQPETESAPAPTVTVSTSEDITPVAGSFGPFSSPATRRFSTLTYLTSPLPAIALHDFVPVPPPPGLEVATREVGFTEGDRLEVLVEDVGGGWSLGRKEGEGEAGLVPRGWYEFVEDIAIETGSEMQSDTTFSDFNSQNNDIQAGTTTDSNEPSVDHLAFDDASDTLIPPASVSAVAPTSFYAGSPLASVLPPSMLSEMEARSASAASPPSSTPMLTLGLPNIVETVEPDTETTSPMSIDSEKSPRKSKRVPAPRVSSTEERALLAAPLAVPAPRSNGRGGGGPACSVRASDAMWQASISRATAPALPSGGGSPTKKKPRASTKTSFLWRSASGAWETTGARSYVLDGMSESEEDTSSISEESEAGDSEGGVGGVTEEERHEVEAGPAWKPRVPLFAVQVHSPITRLDAKRREHTVFAVTSTFWNEDEGDGESKEGEEEGMTRVTVERRYSQFERLASVLATRYPGIVLPGLPEKQYTGRFGATFLETRRRGLERYLTRLVRHPLLRHSAPMTAFLSLDDDEAYEALVASWMASPEAPGTFFARVWHPDYNVDRDEAVREVERFGRFARAVEEGGGVQEVEGALARVRSSMQDLSDRMQELSRSLTRLTAGMALPPMPPRSPSWDDDDEEDDDFSPPDALAAHRKRARAEAVQTMDGAWCWREGCYDCLALTKALQATGSAVGSIGELYHKNAVEALAPVQELVKECANPQRQHKHLLELHRSTLKADFDNKEADARKDTVLNVTLSEIERYHGERAEDFCDIAERYLDEQLELHQHAYDRLRTCRAHFSDEQYSALATSGPRIPNQEELALLEAPSVASSTSSVLGTWNESQTPSYAGSVASTLLRPVAAATSSVIGLKGLFGTR